MPVNTTPEQLSKPLPAYLGWLPKSAHEPAGKALDKVALALSDDGPRSVAARAALFTFAVRIAAAVLAFAGQVVLARMMGAYEYGIYAIIWVWVLVLSTFTAMGYPTGMLRFIPELYKAGRINELRTVIARGPMVSMALCALVAVAGIAVLLAAPHWFYTSFITPMILAAICIPLMTLVDHQEGVSQAFDWPDLTLIPTFIARPLLMLALFVGMTLAGMAPTATTAMIAALAAVLVVTSVQLFILRRRVVAKIGKGPREGQVRPWVKAALPMLVVEGFFFLIINTDVMVAGAFVSPDQVAVYYAAAKTLALVHFVAFAIRIATYHKIAEYHATGDHAALQRTLADTLHWTFWPSLIICVMLLLGGELILSLFGAGFESGMTYLSILLVGVLIRASVGPAEAMLTMANRQSTAAWVYGFVFAINLGLNLALIPTIGLIGAAIATAVSMAFEALFLLIMVRRHIGVISFVGVAGRLAHKASDHQASSSPSPSPEPAQ